MSLLARSLFVVVGLVNLYPVTGMLGAEALETLYGRSLQDPGLVLLMRHRAAFFGLLGALLVGAAWRPSWRGPATVAGLASMLSFVALAGWPPLHDAALRRIYAADVIASVLLVIAAWLSRGAGVVDAERRRD